ncbi:MAG: ABC transporter permease [Saprospiraceae bacterium]
MNLFKLSWKNLINNPLSMTLSLVLFALGVGLISLLLILNKQLQDQFDKNLAGINLVVGAKGSPLQLILSSMYHIDSPTGNIPIKSAKGLMNPKHPLIDQAIPLSMGDSHQGYRIIGSTYDLFGLYNGEIGQGKLWAKDMEVTIGATVADKLGLGLGDGFYSSHGLIIDDNLVHDDAPQFKVAGIFKPTGSVLDQLILTNTQSIWKVHDSHEHEEGESADNHNDHEGHDHSDHEGHDHDEHNHDDHAAENTPKVAPTNASLLENADQSITSLLIKFKSNNYRTLNMQRNINENTDMQAATPAFEINRLYSMMGTGTDALQMLAYVIVFVSGLSIFISLFSSLRERKYELSLMRVMGASPTKIFTLIVLEGLILAILGYLIGIALSHIGMEILAKYMSDAYRYSFSGALFLKEEIYLLFGALGIGFIAAIIPAIQAKNTDISRTLGK